MGVSPFIVVAVLSGEDWNRNWGIGKALNRQRVGCQLCARDGVALKLKISNHMLLLKTGNTYVTLNLG
jgi:hypothetical protein